MPAISKHQARGRSAIGRRWPQPVVVLRETEEEAKDKFRIEDDDEVIADQEAGIIKEEFAENFDLNDLGDMFELCLQQGSHKNISLMLYFKISWRSIDNFLEKIDASRCITAHKWANVFLSDDLAEFNSDLRGGKMSGSFYDMFPDIEQEAKTFAISQCQGKTSDFKASNLRDFIDGKFYEVTGLTKDVNDYFVRSERTCRMDLKQWGAVFEKNSQRPYFEGMQ